MHCMEETKIQYNSVVPLSSCVLKIHPLIRVLLTHISYGRTRSSLIAVTQMNRAHFQPTAQGGVMTLIDMLPFTDRQLSV